MLRINEGRYEVVKLLLSVLNMLKITILRQINPLNLQKRKRKNISTEIKPDRNVTLYENVN
jgi:hypothetical protein